AKVLGFEFSRCDQIDVQPLAHASMRSGLQPYTGERCPRRMEAAVVRPTSGGLGNACREHLPGVVERSMCFGEVPFDRFFTIHRCQNRIPSASMSSAMPYSSSTIRLYLSTDIGNAEIQTNSATSTIAASS